MDESIAKHTSPLEDEEQGYLIRQALAAYVLNRAKGPGLANLYANQARELVAKENRYY